jgi:uncharacterized membrane protein SirB2
LINKGARRQPQGAAVARGREPILCRVLCTGEGVIQAFSDWLAGTWLSTAIQNAFWVIPTIQTVHILAIAVVMTSMALLDLRLMGAVGRHQTLESMADRFLPWVWGALAVLLTSGVLLIVGEPARELGSAVFWLKMSLLVLASMITLAFQYLQRKHPSFWDTRRVLAAATAGASLLLWVAILSAGRWIAYWEHG